MRIFRERLQEYEKVLNLNPIKLQKAYKKNRHSFIYYADKQDEDFNKLTSEQLQELLNKGKMKLTDKQLKQVKDKIKKN